MACANLDKGKAAMSVCGNSCIGCGLCEKECKKDAIHVVNGVAVIDYDKCVGCKLCTKVCPRDAILPKATAEEKEKYKAIKKAQLRRPPLPRRRGRGCSSGLRLRLRIKSRRGLSLIRTTTESGKTPTDHRFAMSVGVPFITRFQFDFVF